MAPNAPTAQRTAPRALVSLLFFISGAIALIYEVLWQRKFSLLFGASTPATSATLAAYFGGLCIGNFLFGKLAHHWTRPLFVYGLLELAIAAGALLVNPILDLYAAAYPSIISSVGFNPAGLSAIKGMLGFLAIALPTIAMGATLPVLSNFVNSDPHRLGRNVGWLYILNMLGASIGTIAVPALLLPRFGTRRLTFICVALNSIIGTISLLLGRQQITTATAQPVAAAREAQPFSIAHPFLAFSFLSGLGIFLLQVLWNRAFAQVHDNSLHSFALITALFILAITFGAQLGRTLLQRQNTPQGLALAWLLGGAIIVTAPFAFLWLTHDLAYIPPGNNAFAIGGPLLLTALLLIFLPIALLSAAIPILIQELATVAQRIPAEVTGSLLAVNTFGCICGALIGGFVLPSSLGLWKSFFLAGLLFIALGLHLALGQRFTSPISFSPNKKLSPLQLFPVLLLAFLLRVDLPRTHLAASEKLLATREGSYGIAAVIERKDNSHRLKLNNHYILGGTLATGDQRMQAHIPLLLAPGGRALFLGYGTGITAGGASFHTNFQSAAIELVPEVASLAETFFRDANQSFASSSRLILDDARNFLRGTREKFDVIVGDLVVPWRPGESALYTREHFEAVRNSLTARGLFCAWIPMFQVQESEFQIILHTFLDVFGQAYLWRGDFSPNQPAYGLLAFRDPHESLKSPGPMQDDPQNPQLRENRAFWLHFVGTIRSADITLPSPINSEDTPWLELGRHSSNRSFVGRNLQLWENRIRDSSRPFIASLPQDASPGSEAGRRMVEFSLLVSEGRQQEALAVQQELKSLLSETAFRFIFGNQ